MASASTPLLGGDASVRSYVGNSDNSARKSLREAKKNKEELERTVSCRRTATKIGGIVLLPLSLCACCCLAFHYVCSNGNTSYNKNEKDIPYSDMTLCNAGNCWQPKLPPKDLCDVAGNACDPCICCVCCMDEKSYHYLTPPERKALRIARETLRRAGPLQQKMDEYPENDRNLTGEVLAFLPPIEDAPDTLSRVYVEARSSYRKNPGFEKW